MLFEHAENNKPAQRANKLSFSKHRLVLLAVPVACFLASQSFAIFLAIFEKGESIEEQVSVYATFVILLILEIALFVGCILCRRKIQPVLKDNKATLVACISGFVGLLLLFVYQQMGQTVPVGRGMLLVCGLLLYALYSVAITLSLGLRVSALTLEDAGFLLGVTGCLYSLISLFLVSVSYAAIIVTSLSCLLIVLLLPLFPGGSSVSEHEEEVSQPVETQKGLMLLLFVSVLFCLIAAVFPRLFTTPVLGAITNSERVFISYISIIVFIVLMILLSVVPVSRKTISLGFAFCAMVFVLSFFLAINLFFSGINEYGTGAIKANQSVFRVFVFILMVFIVKTGRLKPVVAFSLYGLLVLILPEMIINAVSKPLNFAYSFYTMQDLLIPATTITAIVVVVVTSITILLDMYNSRESIVVDVVEYERLLCEAATKGMGLTPREFDILLYLHRGYSVKKTASLLFISTSTAQSHIASLYKKLNVHSKQELIDTINETTL